MVEILTKVMISGDSERRECRRDSNGLLGKLVGCLEGKLFKCVGYR